MEGPSIVIACEELKLFIGKPIVEVSGTADLPYSKLEASTLKQVKSWGKHLLLVFSGTTLKVHFLMFGSYRINQPRENRVPKFFLNFGSDKVFFYSCAIKELPKNWRADYDWSVDLMAKAWNPSQAAKSIKSRPHSQVGDALMDQTLFSGLGNIMKNEILFILKMHPEVKMQQLSASRIKSLVHEAESYAWQFYKWKKLNVLKRNWKIMRKKSCPVCLGKVTKRQTGKLKRLSHFCVRCQKKR